MRGHLLVFYKAIILWLFLAFIVSCRSDNEKVISPPGAGTPVYEPIYESEDLREIELKAAQPIRTGGRVYFKDELIFINEQNHGLHVIDNSNSKNPVSLGFLSIPGNTNNYFNGNTLYADNYSDLVAIDVTNINDISVLHRYKDMMFNEKWALRPPGDKRAYFVCPEQNKGKVIGWKLTEQADAKCFK